MSLRLSIQRWWYIGYGLLWGIQFGLYSSQSFFGSVGFVRLPNDAFNLSSLITVIVCCVLIGLVYWRMPRLPRFMPVAVPTLLYLMSILMLAIPNSPIPLAPLMIGAGIVSGASYSVLLVNWYRLLATGPSADILRRVAASSLLGTALCLVISYAPFSVVMPLVVAFLALVAWMQHSAIARVLVSPEALGATAATATLAATAATAAAGAPAAPAATAAPGATATLGASAPSVSTGSLARTTGSLARTTGPAVPSMRPMRPRQVATMLLGPLMCRCALGFAFAIISQVAFVSPTGFIGSNNLFNLGMFAAAFLFFVMAATTARSPEPTALFRGLFPVLGAALLLLPFLDSSMWAILAMFVTMAAHLVQIAFVFLVADLVYRSRIESNILASFVHAIDQFAILFGIVLGITIIGDDLNTVRLSLITGAVVYLLMMAMFFFVRWNRNRSIVREWEGESGAASDGTKSDGTGSAAGGVAGVAGGGARDDVAGRAASRADHLDAQVGALAASHALTPREREILGYLCRGRSTPYICEELTLSKNTVHSHIKRIYLKLDVHGKQELLDLVE
ncbi:MAG: LuxR family transcriptional regulator [Coriobacteriales bacterium]|jgi:DNA-binding CsgD family transcriptional regulator|nr:LuxR family transcriptional regulator [Coriobacteriales bacterium]